MKRVNLFTMQAFASVLIFLLSACAEDPLGGNDQTGTGHTVTLRVSATVVPSPETKATATPARSGSDAEAAGFKYEMVSSDAVAPGFNVDMESTTPESVVISLGTKAPTTKAPATLKNTYALLFSSEGAFNGRADIGAFTAGTPQDITFTKVDNPKADGCRLVIVANDHAAVTPYGSDAGTGGFASFTGTYPEFQKLIITSGISKDEDVPYAGSATVDLSQSEIGATAEVPLSWTLAKITLNNPTFNITGGPARSSITLYNAGVRRFATQGSDNYDGTGSTQTIDAVASTAGSNANSVTWYVGENIQPAVTSIQTSADRNNSKAPTKACYIRIASAAQSVGAVTSPQIGEEYTLAGTKSFTYDYYLGNSSDVADFALRRHTDYTINTEIDGTLAIQEEIAARDGRVTLTKTGSAGLAIGPFGGASGYTTGTGYPPTINGSYTKLLLLEPNTTRTTATDTVTKQWSTNTTTALQTETRKFWDPTYTSAHIDKASGLAYDYCYNLTLGGVAKGTWYLPTHAQTFAMWSVLRGLQGNSSFANYSAFHPYEYWSSTEGSVVDYTWTMVFSKGSSSSYSKTNTNRIRCVRDATSSSSTPLVSTSTGYPVIDLSSLNPLGCVLSSSETITRREAMYAPGVTPSNEALLSVGLNISGENGTWNAKMSAKYQVMKRDHAVGSTDFVNAWKACKEYSNEEGIAGIWRLPTQRELDMIWILHPQLIGKAGFTAFGATTYWSSTEYDAIWAWYQSFLQGYSSYNPKASPRSVRCVRDLM